MALDKRITMKPDRGLVKYVKIKKKRDNKLEKDFAALLSDEDAEIKKNITLTNAVQDLKDAIDALKKIANELTKRRKQNENRITDAKDKLAVEDQHLTGAKTERERLVIKARQEIFARAQAKSELETQEIEATIKETNDAIDEASALLETKKTKLKESNQRAEELLTKQREMQAAAGKLADDDFADITDVMQKLLKSEKYRQIVPISQNADEYVFMLVQPEEYQGDPISVRVSPEPATPTP